MQLAKKRSFLNSTTENYEYFLRNNGYFTTSREQTNNGAIINTGVIPNRNTEIEIMFRVQPGKNQCWSYLMGSQSYNGSADSCYPARGNYNRYRWMHTSEKLFWDDDYRFLYVTSFTKAQFLKDRVIIDGFCDASTSDMTKNTSTPTYPMAIFGIRRGNSYTNVTPVDVVYCKIWKDDILVRDYIPQIQNDIAGLYDKENDVFYTSDVTSYSFQMLKISEHPED